MIQLQLADLPLDADVANPQGKPLGTREQVAVRFKELLPGTQFDGDGRGAFQRGTYQIAFKMSGDPPTAIGVAFEQVEAFTALKRIVEKTGWCLLDPVAKGFVDIDLSRAVGKTVLVGDDPGIELPTAAPAPAAPLLPNVVAMLPRRSRPTLAAAAGAVLAVAVVFAMRESLLARLPVHLPASILASKRTTTPGREKYADRVRRRTAVVGGLSATFRDNPAVAQLVDFQMGARAYWNSVGDGRFSTPDLLSNEGLWSRYQMQPYLPTSFAQKQREGYEFEFVGDTCEEPDPGWPECKGFVYAARPVKGDGSSPTFALFSADDRIHFRTDGRIPRQDDPTVQ